MVEKLQMNETEDTLQRLDAALDTFARSCNLELKDKANFRTVFTSPVLRRNEQRIIHGDRHDEFLGDRLLNLKLAEVLSEKNSDARTVDIVREANLLARNLVLSRAALDCGMNECLRITEIEARKEPFDQVNLLSNTMEEFLWALYKDQGPEAVHAFVDKHITPLLPEMKEYFNDQENGFLKAIETHRPSLSALRIQIMGRDGRMLKELNPWVIWGHGGPSHPRYPLSEPLPSGTPLLSAFMRDGWDRQFDNWDDVFSMATDGAAVFKKLMARDGQEATINLYESPGIFPGDRRVYALYVNKVRILVTLLQAREKRKIFFNATRLMGLEDERQQALTEQRFERTNASLGQFPPDGKRDSWTAQTISPEETPEYTALFNLAEKRLGRRAPIIVYEKSDENDVFKSLALSIDGRRIHEDNRVIFTRLFIREAVRKLHWAREPEPGSLSVRERKAGTLDIPTITHSPRKNKHSAQATSSNQVEKVFEPGEWRDLKLVQLMNSEFTKKLVAEAQERNMNLAIRRHLTPDGERYFYGVFLNDIFITRAPKAGRASKDALALLKQFKWNLEAIKERPV